MANKGAQNPDQAAGLLPDVHAAVAPLDSDVIVASQQQQADGIAGLMAREESADSWQVPGQPVVADSGALQVIRESDAAKASDQHALLGATTFLAYLCTCAAFLLGPEIMPTAQMATMSVGAMILTAWYLRVRPDFLKSS